MNRRKNLYPLENIGKPLLSHTVNKITGHGPFIDHLALMELTDEPTLPKCGINTDSKFTLFVTVFVTIKMRKKHLMLSKNNKISNINYASRYIDLAAATQNCPIGLIPNRC